MIAGRSARVPAAAGNQLAELLIRHCTLVPGLTLEPNCDPVSPSEASLIAEIVGLQVTIDRTIVGPLLVARDASVKATDSIIDAMDESLVAYAAPGRPILRVPARR